MSINLKKTMAGAAFGLLLVSQLATSAFAAGYNYYYNNPYYSAYNNPYYYQPSPFNTHPILSGTLVGGAVGALGGAAVGALDQQDHGGSSVGTDAAVGAGTGAALGAGVGIIRNRQLTGSWF